MTNTPPPPFAAPAKRKRRRKRAKRKPPLHKRALRHVTVQRIILTGGLGTAIALEGSGLAAHSQVVHYVTNFLWLWW